MTIVRDYHSVHDLNYHLVLVTKYRREVITDDISDYLKETFTRIGEKYSITVTEFNHDKDHIHVLFQASPVTSLSKFLNSYKSASSRLVKKEYPEIRDQLWQEKFWTHSYYLASSGGVSLDVLKKYIQKQGLNDEDN